MARRAKKTQAFSAARFGEQIIAAGGELLAPTNPYEVMRFRTRFGVGVIYQNAKGSMKWSAEAEQAAEHLRAGNGSLAAVVVHGRRRDAATVRRIIARDGENCFFCRTPLGANQTVEHLVSIAHGGPNHIANLFLAHGACNRRAGHLSAPEKIALRDNWPQPSECEAA